MADWLGPSRPEEQYSKKFLRFSFCFMYPKLSDGEAYRLETPTHKGSPDKSLLSLSSGRGKGQSSSTEKLETVRAVLQPHPAEPQSPFHPCL